MDTLVFLFLTHSQILVYPITDFGLPNYRLWSTQFLTFDSEWSNLPTDKIELRGIYHLLISFI